MKKVPFVSFGKWNHAAGVCFVRQRIYWRGWYWTPFVWVKKRYLSWFGYWRSAK